ncbi:MULTISPECIES: hypothetical protein [unclassified Pseudomonas]|uniref:hypothetical protein n=1 Tax=unclassified Pseudomonas TaxID=196821 RepID=UPI0003432371|nr:MULTISPECIES: hypothetical protein [unclassified Pseudomonas]EPA95364.1 hypothetical protein PG5_40920 [Pseudomonas sp. G5(2012)]OOL37098.1 hypothetical protein BOO94_14305 [Pseudomonas sp. FSL W5-0299]
MRWHHRHTGAIRLREELSDQSLLLLGPLEGDALVSAFNPLSIREESGPTTLFSPLARQLRISRPQIGATCLPIRCSSLPWVAFD